MIQKKFIVLFHLLLVSSLCCSQFISKKKATEDLHEFKKLLETQSSYYQVSNFDFGKQFDEAEKRIQKEDSLPMYQLAFELEKIISNIIDRHANIRMEDFEEDEHESFHLYFPFTVASLGDQIVALTFNKQNKEYQYADSKYPYIKAVDGVPIKTFLERNAYTRKLSPKPAKLTDQLKDLRDIGALYFKQGKTSLNEIKITLTNGETNKEVNLPLSPKRNWYFDTGSLAFNRAYIKFGRDKEFKLSSLHKWLPDSIAYIAIPSMESYEDLPNLESYLSSTFETFRSSKALIIDIRGNSGGTREILSTISGYLIQPEQSPWVSNVAYVRSDQLLDEDISSMQSRFLYNYHSELFSEKDRKAIDAFTKDFKTAIPFSIEKFSEPFFMVLHSKAPLNIPVYILVNEECFSAASVFTSAFKGLRNVKIVGVTTHGSSGRSRKFYLKNSNIRVKLSTMLSFQRNGKTLDGNGTVPDIVIERDENQLFRKSDTQLEKLIEIINQSI